MSNDRQFRIEDLINSAGEVSDVAPDLKKRVLRAARKAEQRRIMRRRIQWALSGSAAAIILAAIFGIMTTPQHSETHVAPGTMSRPAPSVIPAPEHNPEVEKAHDAAKENLPGHRQRIR